jgi:hypothetical protein
MNAPKPTAMTVGATAQRSVREVCPNPWTAVPDGLMGVRRATGLVRVTAMVSGACLPLSASDPGRWIGWAMAAF